MKRAFMMILLLISHGVMGADCKGPDGKWYPYESPQCGGTGVKQTPNYEPVGPVSSSPTRMPAAAPPQTTAPQFSRHRLDYVRTVNSELIATLEVAGIKARDCEWSIKVTKEMSKCNDFADYFNRDVQSKISAWRLLGTEEMKAAGVSVSDLSTITRKQTEIARTRDLLNEYIKANRR